MKQNDLKKVEDLNEISSSQDEILKKVSDNEVLDANAQEEVSGGKVDENSFNHPDTGGCTLCSPIL